MRFVLLPLMAAALYGQSNQVCSRPGPGGLVREPADLRSSGGKLEVDFSFRSDVDIYGVTRYCYVSSDGIQSPTLRVQPGDEVVLRLKNDLPATSSGHAHPGACGTGSMTASTTNLHFHGLNIPPTCHQDEVLRTAVEPGDTPFEYRIHIPADEAPGLYWYHPHPHGFSERQVLGGASGALIVEGIERAAPVVVGMPQRVLVLRDQRIGGMVEDSSEEGDRAYSPTLDLSLNYVPVMFPLFKPATMLVRPKQREFWRALNASADTFFQLQLLYWPTSETQVAQSLQVIAIDGVPVGPNFAPADRTSILLPPGARVEFVMTAPSPGMLAQFLTKRYDNGPTGNSDSYRVLANIRALDDAPPAGGTIPTSTQGPYQFAPLTALHPTRERKLYFSEKAPDPSHPKLNVSYFLTEGDHTPKVFDMAAAKPDVTVTQGTIEDWTIENRAQESHAFHIHQLHFQVLERDGKPVNEPALRDTIDLPFWDGKSFKYPSLKLRMDFRNPNITGTFLYHCHILEHEDGGMMGTIEVVRPPR